VDVEVTELAPGELEVRAGADRCRVVVPAGVGVAGYSDEELAAALAEELLARTGRLPTLVDVSHLLGDPAMMAAIEQRLERGATDADR
jgi:hypothetical protein